MGKSVVKHFRFLSPQQILAQRSGPWGDYALLEVLHYFSEKNDHKRRAAVLELILRSPEHDEMVAYEDLYFDLIQHTRSTRDYPAALRWAYGSLAYDEQRQSGMNRANTIRDTGEIYLHAGMLDNGLAILTRCLETDPADIWIYNSLALTLLEVSMADLALEVIDRALELVAQDDPEHLQDQLSDMREDARARMAGEESRLVEVTPAVLAKLQVALRLSPDPPEDLDAYLPPVDSLISLEENGLETTYDEIMSQGEILAPDLIRLAFDENLRATPAPGHAVTLLHRLSAEWPVEMAELALWLERAQGDWSRELLTEWAGKIGGYYTDELEAFAADTTYNRSFRSFAVSALVERAQKCPDQRERIIQGMRTLLTRSEAYEATEETFIGFLIADIEDLGAKELYPEIEAAFAEDRVDPTIIDLHGVQESWGMPVSQQPKPREDGLTLRLRCKPCGRVRQHFVQHVIIDSFTQEKAAAGKTVKYAPQIMDREIICPKCGARDQYEPSPEAFLQLMMPAGGLEGFAALLDSQGDAPERKLNPRVEVIGSMVFNRPMHPLEGLERYRKLIAADPQNVTLYYRMGMLLRTIRRFQQALKAFRQGYEKGTDNPEFILQRAMAEHDFGEQALAKGLYEETIALLERQPIGDPYIFELGQTARRGYRLLKQNKKSPWQLELIEEENAGTVKPSWQSKRKKSRRPKKKRRK